MSLIGEILGDLIFEALGALFWRLFHATGRRLIFLLTFGGTRVPSAGAAAATAGRTSGRPGRVSCSGWGLSRARSIGR